MQLANKDQLTPEQLYQIPEKWMITYSFIPGLLIGLYVAIYIITAYVPSTVSTVLKLRCGMIKTLRDPNFFIYRKASEMIYLNVGNMVFSFLGSVCIFFAVSTYLIFMCLYPPKQPIMAMFFAAFFAVFITVVVRVI